MLIVAQRNVKTANALCIFGDQLCFEVKGSVSIFLNQNQDSVENKIGEMVENAGFDAWYLCLAFNVTR
jgi:hypothetical protein